MSISDRLDEISARCEVTTPGPWYAESRNVDDPYSLTTVYNVFHNGDTADRDLVAEVAYDNAEFIAASRTDVPELVEAVRRRDAALRAVLDACDRIDASIIPSGDFEVGQKSVTQTIRMIVERKLSTVPSAAESARAIAAALGEGQL